MLSAESTFANLKLPDYKLPMRFLISAGEASGDTYGAQLVVALRKRDPEAEFFGLGGAGMRAVGCNTVVDAAEVAVVGLAEVVSHLPRIYQKFRLLLRAVDEHRPQAAVLIDFPDFNFRLARQLHQRGVPVYYYVSPQLWAWRARRVELVRSYIRKMLVIFPFEEEWYRHRGVDAHYVGHPLADLPGLAESREQFARQYGLDPQKQWIALLPGSRRKEVSLNLPNMLGAAALLNRETPAAFQFVMPVASTLRLQDLQNHIKNYNHSGDSELPIELTRDARATLKHARAAVVASGTATVESTLIGTPFVMVYRVAFLTWLLGHHMVGVPHYAMPNLIAARRVVPEIVQREFTSKRVVEALQEIIPEGPARARMLAGLAEIRQALSPGQQSASERAAEIILGALV
jgi:lipid-A-disaccharide synthase